MKTSVATAAVATVLVGVSILAVPAVASGAEYLADASSVSASASAVYVPTAATTVAASSAEASAASPSADLSLLVTIWGASGVLLLGGGALAVRLSARRQRSLAV
ncbi:MAG: hypothetical protein Q7U41_03315 [Microbacterium sp.]|nr:hypothetical protein [Microbacterium sp.]